MFAIYLVGTKIVTIFAYDLSLPMSDTVEINPLDAFGGLISFTIHQYLEVLHISYSPNRNFHEYNTTPPF